VATYSLQYQTTETTTQLADIPPSQSDVVDPDAKNHIRQVIPEEITSRHAAEGRKLSWPKLVRKLAIDNFNT